MDADSSEEAEPRALVFLPVQFVGMVAGAVFGHVLLVHVIPGAPVALTEMLVAVGSLTAGVTVAMATADSFSRQPWLPEAYQALVSIVGAVAVGVVVASAVLGYVVPWEAGGVTESIVLTVAATAAAMPFVVEFRSALRDA